MRVVIDTSVLVRLVSSKRGLSRLRNSIKYGLVLVISDYLLEELERTLYTKFGMTRQRAKVAAGVMARLSVSVTPQNIPKISRDPTDDPVLATAVAGKVEYLVSDDKDLLVLKTSQGVKIIQLEKFLHIISDKSIQPNT